jgi:transposase-like protein
MDYPKIKREEKKNCKLSDKQIIEIKILYKTGKSMRSLAKTYGVARITIRYWVDEEYRKRDSKRVQDKIRSVRSTKEGKEKLNKQRMKELKDARNRIPKLKEYHKKELLELKNVNQKLVVKKN